MRETEAYQAHSENGRRDGNHAHQSADIFANGKRQRRDQRSKSHGSHQKSQRVRAAMQHPGCEDRHQNNKGHTHQADQGEEREDDANGQKAGDISPAGFHLGEHRCGLARHLRGGQAHQHEREDDGDVADAVDEETPALTADSDQHSGKRRTDESRHVNHGRIDGDGVLQVALVFDHLDHERLAAGHVEGIDAALHHAERKQHGNVDEMRKCEGSKCERLHHGEGLRPDQNLAAVETVDPDTRKRRKNEGGNLSGEADCTQQQSRAGEAVDKPARRDARHPGADERDGLATEKETEVAGAQGAPSVREACCGWFF